MEERYPGTLHSRRADHSVTNATTWVDTRKQCSPRQERYKNNDHKATVDDDDVIVESIPLKVFTNHITVDES